MMGSHREQDSLFSYHVNLDKRVRVDHPLRAIRANVDFTFIRQEVAHLYGANGNVSIDPVIILKLMFLLFFDDVRSERALMDLLPERLDYLWFLGLGLDDPIPDHSVLSKARARWGTEAMETFFTRTVSQCIEAGLVRGDKLHMDGSLVDANASLDSVRNGPAELIAALRETFQRQANKLNESAQIEDTPDPNRKPKRVSTTDPDAAVIARKGSGVHLRYKVHRAVDDAHGVITAT